MENQNTNTWKSKFVNYPIKFCNTVSRVDNNLLHLLVWFCSFCVSAHSSCMKRGEYDSTDRCCHNTRTIKQKPMDDKLKKLKQKRIWKSNTEIPRFMIFVLISKSNILRSKCMCWRIFDWSVWSLAGLHCKEENVLCCHPVYRMWEKFNYDSVSESVTVWSLHITLSPIAYYIQCL